MALIPVFPELTGSSYPGVSYSCFTLCYIVKIGALNSTPLVLLFAFSFLVTVSFRPMTNYHVDTRDNRPRLHVPEGSLYLTWWPSSIVLLLHLTSLACLFLSSLLHLPSCSCGYFSLIASSEHCSSPLTWRLLSTSSQLSRPYKDLLPITNHSSSLFPFAHSGTNLFQQGIANGLCHRLHIFSVLWTPPRQKKLTAMQ